jgi:hypothetical protein
MCLSHSLVLVSASSWWFPLVIAIAFVLMVLVVLEVGRRQLCSMPWKLEIGDTDGDAVNSKDFEPEDGGGSSDGDDLYQFFVRLFSVLIIFHFSKSGDWHRAPVIQVAAAFEEADCEDPADLRGAPRESVSRIHCASRRPARDEGP